MKWFKHYSNASDSVKLSRLVDELGVEGYGRYWLLLELLCEEYDGESTEFEVHFRKISAKVQIKFSKKLETFLQKLADFYLIEFRVVGKVYKLSAPILSELKNRDFKKARHDRAESAPKNKIKKKIKDKEKELEAKASSTELENSSSCGAVQEFSNDQDLTNFLRNVKKSTQRLWIKTYGDIHWLRTEILKAMAWLDANPRKKPKGKNPARFLGNWFAIGWESYRKTIPSQQSNEAKGAIKLALREANG